MCGKVESWKKISRFDENKTKRGKQKILKETENFVKNRKKTKDSGIINYEKAIFHKSPAMSPQKKQS